MNMEELAKEYERIADEIEDEKPEYARVLREDAMRCRGYDDIIELTIEEKRALFAKRMGIDIEEVTNEALEEYESQFR